jgi:chemotaxis protein CheX
MGDAARNIEAGARMTARLALDARLDSAAAPGLIAALKLRQGEDLVLDAGAVTLLGALCAQALALAGQSWAAAGLSLRLDPVSSDLSEAARLLGLAALPPFCTEGAA